MPLAQPLSDTRRYLREILVEDLVAALRALKELLPETAGKHAQALALLGRLNDANRERVRNTLAPDEYQRRVDTVRAQCLDLIDSLEAADFEAPAPGQPADAAKQGSVLYRVPHRMCVRKPTICTVRVATDTDAVLDDIVLDDDVRLRERVEVSDLMKAELLDPEGDVFAIRPLNDAEQLVRSSGYTQWLFSVTPRVGGQHQLLVKVSMLEYVEQLGRFVPRDVSVLETVTIVAETEAADDDADEETFKDSGERLRLKAETREPAKSRARLPGGLRSLAFFLIFLLLGSTATVWAMPPWQRESLWVNAFHDTPAAQQQLADKYKNEPRAIAYVEKAVKRKAELTDSLGDWRAYQRMFPEGRYQAAAAQHIETLDAGARSLLRQNPSPENIRRYALDFYDSPHFDEVKQTAETRPAELLPALEDALAQSVQEQPAPENTAALIEYFPSPQNISSVAEVARKQPALAPRVQPLVDAALLRQITVAVSVAEAKPYLPVLKTAASAAAATQAVQIAEQRPALKPLAPQIRQIAADIQKLELDSDGDGMPDRTDGCPNDRNKTAPGACGCGAPDTDTDGDGVADCKDGCPQDKSKTAPGACGCGAPDTDTDGDGVADCKDGCPQDKSKTAPGACGCGAPDTDTDGDGIADCKDQCPSEKGPLANNGCPAEPPPANPGRSGLDLVTVPGGTFTMGCLEDRDGGDCGDDEKPPHEVSLSAFQIGRYEVTQADWRSVMGSDPPKLYNEGCDLCPVEGVSWEDVQAFIKKLNARSGKRYRLPTEAEWEYAARGGNRSKRYRYAGSNDPAKVAWFDNNYKVGNEFGAEHTTHPVGEKGPNELGLYDMSGNVYEWCADWYDREYYSASPRENPLGPASGVYRVYRGGGWFGGARLCRAAYRPCRDPAYRDGSVGFRLAASLQ